MIQIEFKDYKKDTALLIDNRATFEICRVPVADMLEVSQYVEKLVEDRLVKCRVYTKNRIAALLAGLLNPGYGILSAVSITAHNLLTYDPDYEIARDIANNRVEVVWKK